MRHLFLVGLVEALEYAGSRFAEETGAAVASEKGRLMSLQFGQLKLALADEGFFELILDLLPLLLNFGRKSAHFGTLAIYSLLKSVPLEAVVVFEFEEFLKFQVEFAVGRVGWIALLPEIGLEQTLLGVQVVANGVQLLLLQVGAVVFLLANAVDLGSKLPHILLVATRHLLILLNARRGIAVDLFGLAVGHLAAKKQTSLHRRRI